jgi:hypothetical protein
LPRVRSRGSLVLVGAAAGVVVAAAVTAAVVLSDGGDSTGTPAAHSVTTPRVTTAPKTPAKSAAPGTSATSTRQATSPSVAATKASSPSSASSSSTAGSSSDADIEAQLVSTITTYYQLVPDNLSQAWGYLTPDYQQNKALGFDNYQSFWQGMQRIVVSNVVATSPDTVAITIDYYPKSGRPSEERTSFTLVQDGGGWKIAHSTVLSSKGLS